MLFRCHGLIAATQTMRGHAQLAQGRTTDAQKTLQIAMDCWRIEYGPNSPGYAMARASLGRTWALQGKFSDAETALIESYPIIVKSTRRPDREAASMVKLWIESLYQSMGHPETAHKYFAQFDTAPRRQQ